MRSVFAVMAVLALQCLCAASQAVMETVTVGDAGNAADTTGYGSVGYNYNIGKYEVTAGQYTEFLNAKAATDTYALYSAFMWTDSYGCKIERNGASGSYTYSVASEYANRPVNFVSWYDTLRFANWLTNGQGSGDTESGSYLITGGGVNSGTVTIPMHASATTLKWFLTSEDEWYKAAYYSGGGTYSFYANGASYAPAAGTEANYALVFGSTWDGSVNGAVEQNGAKDLAGNVSEWTEGVMTGGISRATRGGSFGGGADNASLRYGVAPVFEHRSIGFRVSEVPEPSSIIALAGGLISLFGLRRRRV